MFCVGELKTDRPNQDLVAKKIQNYIFKYDDLLGKGNFGQAYKGFDVTSGKEVAIKVVKMSSLKSKTCQKLLENEVEILKSLPSHPNILKCHDVFTSVNNCYIVTQLCEYDLQKQLHKKDKFTQQQIRDVVYGIYKGLGHLAQNHIVHRDIKVSNIFLSKNGIPKIADFGFAIKANTMFRDVNIGSPLYMSPESLIYRQYGPKTDIWSFGVLIYELVTGETPLEKCKTDEQLKSQILKQFNLPKFISTDLREVIQKCLTVDETKRPSILQLGKLPYFFNMRNQTLIPKTFKKQGQGSSISTECSLKHQRSFDNPYFYSKPLSYDNGLSLLHYCRLLHKIDVKFFKSQVFFTFLMNLSNSLCNAQTLAPHLISEQVHKFKNVIKEYQRKFMYGREEIKLVINPREMLAQIGQLMSQEVLKNRLEALEILDAETKVLIYSLQHQNAEILTKNSEAKTVIESNKLLS